MFKESRNYLLRGKFSRAVTVYQRSQRPRLPPLSGPLFPRPAPRLPPRWLSQAGPPPLYEEWFWPPAPRPRCDGVGGSWPDSQRGGGQGRGSGGVGLLFATSFFLAGAGTGTTDSSRVRLAAGSPSWPPWPPCARSAMSFLAATLLAFEVRCMPSPAQMLAPSTVVRS
jgi:hypothetical protein